MIEYFTLSGGLFAQDGSGSLDLAALAPWLVGAGAVLLLLVFFLRRR